MQPGPNLTRPVFNKFQNLWNRTPWSTKLIGKQFLEQTEGGVLCISTSFWVLQGLMQVIGHSSVRSRLSKNNFMFVGIVSYGNLVILVTCICDGTSHKKYGKYISCLLMSSVIK